MCVCSFSFFLVSFFLQVAKKKCTKSQNEGLAPPPPLPTSGRTTACTHSTHTCTEQTNYTTVFFPTDTCGQWELFDKFALQVHSISFFFCPFVMHASTSSRGLSPGPLVWMDARSGRTLHVCVHASKSVTYRSIADQIPLRCLCVCVCVFVCR